MAEIPIYPATPQHLRDLITGQEEAVELEHAPDMAPGHYGVHAGRLLLASDLWALVPGMTEAPPEPPKPKEPARLPDRASIAAWLRRICCDDIAAEVEAERDREVADAG